jgi:hypothetical protein
MPNKNSLNQPVIPSAEPAKQTPENPDRRAIAGRVG